MVATKTGFATITFDRGTRRVGQRSAADDDRGHQEATYKTVTVTIPTNAVVRDNGQKATLSEIKAGQRAHRASTVPSAGFVLAHDAGRAAPADGRAAGSGEVVRPAIGPSAGCASVGAERPGSARTAGARGRGSPRTRCSAARAPHSGRRAARSVSVCVGRRSTRRRRVRQREKAVDRLQHASARCSNPRTDGPTPRRRRRSWIASIASRTVGASRGTERGRALDQVGRRGRRRGRQALGSQALRVRRMRATTA